MKVYRPYSKPTEFFLTEGGAAVPCLFHRRLGYRLTWPADFHPPRTGVLMCRFLDTLALQGQRVLDIGTGSSAILAIHSAKLGARSVIAIDSDKRVLGPARHNVHANSLAKRLKIEKGDVSTYRHDSDVDLILANLPFMPARSHRSLHDDGGRDGRMCIKALLDLAPRCLSGSGSMFFMVPDFVGVNRSYGADETLAAIAAKRGLKLTIARMYKMEVRTGSYTARHLDWIRTVYPRYPFGTTRSGLPTHLLYIVSAVQFQSKLSPKRVIGGIFFDLGDTLIHEVVDDVHRLDEVTLHAVPHARNILAKLSKLYPIGVITNTETSTEKSVRAALCKLGLERFVSVVVTSSDEGVSKPDKKIFTEALRRAGVRADEAVMIGNDPIADILGASEVGMLTILYRPAQRRSPFAKCGADYCINSLAELPAILSSLGSREHMPQEPKRSMRVTHRKRLE